MKRNKLRGFKILDGKRNRNLSIKLLAVNGNRFIVITSKYVLGILWSTKTYEFDQRSTAEFFYQKIVALKIKERRLPLS